MRCLCADSEAATGGIDSNLEQTRTIVASLQTAVDFVKVVSKSLAVLTQLLASSTMTDVQESITLLIYCHKFQVHCQSSSVQCPNVALVQRVCRLGRSCHA